jgi:hypothetical protein
MKTVDATVILIKDAEDARAYLRSVGVKAPSLHPRVRSESTRDRWNGWNYAKAAGVDDEGYPVVIESWHFASGGVDFSGQWANQGGRLGSIAFDEFRWPIRVFHAKAIIVHPEHTPTEETA